MANINYGVIADFTAIESLIKKLENGEEAVTRWMQIFGYPIAEEKMVELTPVSKIKNKKHAKESDPYKMIAQNLGFEIVTKGGAAYNKGSFGYLVFPDEGRGRKNPRAQNFTGKSKVKALEEMIPLLKENLLNYLEGK